MREMLDIVSRCLQDIVVARSVTLIPNNPDKCYTARWTGARVPGQVQSYCKGKACTATAGNEQDAVVGLEVRQLPISCVERAPQSLPWKIRCILVQCRCESIARVHDELRRIRGNECERVRLCKTNGRQPQERV